MITVNLSEAKTVRHHHHRRNHASKNQYKKNVGQTATTTIIYITTLLLRFGILRRYNSDVKLIFQGINYRLRQT